MDICTTAHTGLDLPSENLSGGNCLPLRVRRALQPPPCRSNDVGQISLSLIVAAGPAMSGVIPRALPWQPGPGKQSPKYPPNFHLTEQTSINCGRQQRSLILALCSVRPYNLPSGTCLHVQPCQLSCSIHSFPSSNNTFL